MRLSANFKKSGFTLIEILAVLIIFTVLITVAVGFIQRGPINLKTMGQQLTRDIQGLGFEAVKNATIYRLSFTDDNKAYLIQQFQAPLQRPSSKDKKKYDQWLEAERSRESLSPDERASQTRLDRGTFKTVKKKELKEPVVLSELLTTRGLEADASRQDKNKKDNSIFFYPSGETDQALVVLTDQADHYFSLQIQPLTGRVQGSPEHITDKEWKKSTGKD